MVVLGSFRIIELISTKIVLLSFLPPNGQCDCLYRPEWQNLLDDFLNSTAMHRKTVSRHVETSTARLATLFGLKCEPVKLTRNVLKVKALFQSARLD